MFQALNALNWKLVSFSGANTMGSTPTYGMITSTAMTVNSIHYSAGQYLPGCGAISRVYGGIYTGS
jgi:hypothetical protein